MNDGTDRKDGKPAPSCSPSPDLALERLDREPSWAVGQLGQSLDGFIATASGDSHYVTGPESLVHLHRLRALCDVVLVGAGTVAADDPSLTVRHVPGRHPVRAVLDPAARLDGTARLFHDDAASTVWLCDARHAARARERLGAAVSAPRRQPPEVFAIEGLLEREELDPHRVLSALAARGWRRVLVEGGGVTVSRFMAAGSLQRLHLVVAPVLIGQGRRGLQFAPWASMQGCPRIPADAYLLGRDVLWDLDLRGAEPRIESGGS